MHQIHAYDVEIDPGDSSHIFVTADNGLVIHASTNPDHRPAPRILRPGTFYTLFMQQKQFIINHKKNTLNYNNSMVHEKYWSELFVVFRELYNCHAMVLGYFPDLYRLIKVILNLSN